MKAKFTKQTTKIIQGKKKNKRYFDQQGNEINQDDPDIMKLIAEGKKIKYYHEEKDEKGKERHVVRKHMHQKGVE